MIEVTGDLWEVAADARVITTNGLVKKNGEAVMGRGVAKQAAERYRELPRLLGERLRQVGNHVSLFIFGLVSGDELIISFPVKHNWWEKAAPELIKRSAKELVRLADKYEWQVVVLPRPGCGNGGLRWEDVKPIVEPLLDGRFVIVEWAA